MKNNLAFIMIILIVFLPNLLYCEEIKEIGPELLWEKNGVAVCTFERPQASQSLVLDNEGGAIIVWNDSRNDPDCYMIDRGHGGYLDYVNEDVDVYAQHIDKGGVIKWAKDGIPVSAGKGIQSGMCVTDGEGGAIIIWSDNKNRTGDRKDSNFFAQRIDKNGTMLWEKPTTIMSMNSGYRSIGGVIPDGEHGVIVIWYDHGNYNSTKNIDIYTQRVDSSGNIKWRSNGVVLSNKKIWKGDVHAISDGDNGIIVLWEEMIKQNETDIYAQRINKNGEVLWGENGIPICNEVKAQGFPDMIPDGKGGAIIVWEDWRNDIREINNIYNCDIYVQRVNEKGEMLWKKDGICIADEKGQLRIPTIVSDNEGGAIILWNIYENWDRVKYAQRINSNGEKLWKKEGLPFPWLKYLEDNVKYIPDNYSGVIIVWSESKDYSGKKTNLKIQRINKDGAVLWNGSGVVICDADNVQKNPQIVLTEKDSAIITWGDNRKKYDKYNYDTNIYAQKIKY